MARQKIQEIPLVERATGTEVLATVYDGLSSENLKELGSIRYWALLLRKLSIAQGYEDSHWDWHGKNQFFTGRPNVTTLVIELECRSWKKLFTRKTQGVIIFYPGRSSLNSATSLIYVDYLSTAPHNRRWEWGIFSGQGKYRGVGTALLAFAASESLSLSFNGTVGLHSLPRAKDFYLGSGLIDYRKVNDKPGLVYFEGVL